MKPWFLRCLAMPNMNCIFASRCRFDLTENGPLFTLRRNVFNSAALPCYTHLPRSKFYALSCSLKRTHSTALPCCTEAPPVESLSISSKGPTLPHHPGSRSSRYPFREKDPLCRVTQGPGRVVILFKEEDPLFRVTLGPGPVVILSMKWTHSAAPPSHRQDPDIPIARLLPLSPPPSCTFLALTDAILKKCRILPQDSIVPFYYAGLGSDDTPKAFFLTLNWEPYFWAWGHVGMGWHVGWWDI
ncbi:hypothetical protein BJ741DRAFT_615658 [Chytriomyces cf. hyalinus JEL632]|nr:hypothetical protein BJ741DRAFT_615658 [Chytriomyces cf. hyalinus JEL632]